MRFLATTLLFLSISFPLAASENFKEIEDIQEGAFRYLIQKHPKSSLFCLSLAAKTDGSYKDPNPSFLKRFTGARVKLASECILNKTSPTLSEKDAILLTVGDIKQIGKSEAAVRVQYFRNLEQSGAGFANLKNRKMVRGK